jgi:hypothetical protein
MKEDDELYATHALFDLRVETLAAALIDRRGAKEDQFTQDEIIVAPIGSEGRRYGYEVAKIKKKHYYDETALLLEVNRKGIFDTLPDRLFLHLDEPYESPKAKTRAIRQQISEARKFFLPFEQSIYLTRIEIDRWEQKWTQNFPDFIKRLWGLDKFKDVLDKRQQFLLCYLLPESYRVVGNWTLTGFCFEAVLRKPIDLNFIAPLTYEPEEEGPPLSERNLGEDTLLGSQFKDDVPALEVCVRGVTTTELPDYLETGRQKKILEHLLYSYFLPLDIAVVTRIQVTEDSWSNELGQFHVGFNFSLSNARTV